MLIVTNHNSLKYYPTEKKLSVCNRALAQSRYVHQLRTTTEIECVQSRALAQGRNTHQLEASGQNLMQGV